MKEKIKNIIKNNLFATMLSFSIFLHFSVYAAYYISTIIEPEEIDSSSIKQDVDVNFEEIPPELIGGTSSPAPVEKQDWVEGNKETGDDPILDDINVNAVSGNGTDKDGYLFSFNGDKVPTPIIDFDLKQFFPAAAKAANITDQTVVVLVQTDETGALKSAKLHREKLVMDLTKQQSKLSTSPVSHLVM